MIAYHGTTRENAEKILSGQAKEEPTWNVSDDEYLYVWCPDAMLHGEYPEAEDTEEAERIAITRAFESAQITAAMSTDPQSELVAICFDFEEEAIEEDLSCENMETARRVEDFIGMERAHVKTLVSKHNSRLDALVICQVLENPLLASWRIDDDLREAAEAMKGIYLDSLNEFDWMEE